MTEEDARLALLQTELNSIQSGISRMDTILFQINGWCVTASLAIGGFAVTSHQPALLIVGAGAVVGFYLIQCQFKITQRAFIRRNKTIESELMKADIMQFLKGGADKLKIVGTTPMEWESSSPSFLGKIKKNFPGFWEEARRPSSYSLYLFILGCLAIEGIILA